MSKQKEPQRFNPELDGHGRVLSPVKRKHLPKRAAIEPSLGAALRKAFANQGP